MFQKLFSFIGAGAIASTSIAATTTVDSSNKHDKIIEGQQYLTDYYSNIIDRGNSITSVINRISKNYGIVESVQNVSVKPLSNKGWNEIYNATTTVTSYGKPTPKIFNFKVNLNLKTFQESYPKLGKSFTKAFGNPSDSGFDVDVINYLSANNNAALKYVAMSSLNLKKLPNYLSPKGKNPIQNSHTGSGIRFRGNSNFVDFQFSVTYQTPQMITGFDFFAIYNKNSGITTIPELFNVNE